MAYMYKIFSAGVTLFITVIVSAQQVRVAAGKKCKMVTDTKMSTGMSMMGQEVEVESTGAAFSDIEIKTVSSNGFSMIATVKRMKGSVNAMGQEQRFDSDDESVRNNPQMTEVFKTLNRPQEIAVENGKASNNGELGTVMSQYSGALTDVAKLVLTIPVDLLEQGYRWSDSSISEEARVINQYVVTKTDDAQIEVTVSTDSKISGAVKQGGMEVKQNMRGAIISSRIYQKINGFLVSEKSVVDLSGTAEIMGMNSPVTVKGTITTTVE